MLEIIIGIVVFISIIIILFMVIYNKFQFAIIKIDEAENNTDIFLEKKKELIDRIKPIFIEELKNDKILDNLENTDLKSINHFESNKLLKTYYFEVLKIIDENDQLINNENIMNIMNELDDNEESLIGSIKFYNDNVVLFNKLIVSFPSNIIRLFFRYRKKEFYQNEKLEMYEILKEK